MHRGRIARIRYLVTAIAFAQLLTVSIAEAQLTTEQLLDPYVAESTDEFKEVQEAVGAFKEGQFAQARTLLHQARRKHPNLAPAEVMLARLFLSAQRLPQAKDSLERAVAQERDDPESYLLLADLALRERQIIFAELALERAEQLLEKYDRNKRRLQRLQVALHAGMATVKELRGLDEEALVHLKAWITVSPKNAIAYSRAAKSYFRQKKYDEARSMLEQLAKISENALQTDVALALLYEEAGMREEARSHMLEAVKRGGKELRTRLAVAEWALNAGITDLAKSNVDSALEIDKDSLAAKLLAGRISRQRGELDDAKVFFEAVLAKSPGNFAATNQLALTLAETGDDEEEQRARQLAELNLRLHSDQRSKASREAAITLAWLLFKAGRENDAEKAIQSALRGGAISSESAYYVSKIFSQRGKKELAAKILGPVLAVKRAFPHRDDAQALHDQLTSKDE